MVYELKSAFSDDTTQVLLEPHDFIARLAALVAHPRGHLIGYHGPFAPNARHRQTIVPAQRCQSSGKHTEATTDVPRAPMSWMARLKRAFDIDVSRSRGAPFGFYNSYPKLGETTAYEPKLGNFVEKFRGRKRSVISELRAGRAPAF